MYANYIDVSEEAKQRRAHSKKSRFVLKVPALPEAVVMGNNNFLFVGSNSGGVFVFELQFLIG